MNYLTIALFCEGTTDERFLTPIIERTYQDVISKYSNVGTIEVLRPYHFAKSTVEKVREKLAKINGYQIAIVHVDADSEGAEQRLNSIVQPIIDSFEGLKQAPVGVPLIPIRETEAWLLADIEVLKNALNTTKSKQELGLTQQPEAIADPKKAIEGAVQLVQKDMPPKLRKSLSIAGLYQPLGEQISIPQLQQLPSYQSFYQAAEQSLKTINFIT